MRKYVIHDPVFGGEIILLVGTPQDYKNCLRKTFKNVPAKAYDIDDADGASEGFFKRNGCFAAILWLNGWKNDIEHQDTLNHEATHAMHFLFLYREIHYTMEHDEVAAYYHSWIFTECLKKLRKGKK